jgi:CRP-like cAMP-binding protein
MGRIAAIADSPAVKYGGDTLRLRFGHPSQRLPARWAARAAGFGFEPKAAVEHDFWHLHQVDWLSALSSDALKRESTLRTYAPGDMIFAPTPQAQSVYFVEKGLVRIYRLSESGDQATFGYVTPGEIFGELVLFGSTERESFAEAVIKSEVRRIPREVFERLLASQASVGIEITKQIGARMKRIESRVEHLVFRDVRARIARVLLELADDFGARRGEETVIDLPLTQSELATLVGSVRQTVNENLRRFEQDGWIRREGRRIVVRKREDLERVAQTLRATD